ncbi:peptide methionine sulfoxide reductase-like isoform X1 [Macrosteles quadrilineatus]|uniref:peptide methionine sulfoxide reductase-like isoform X1 n=1 Tax=Macrosteles quadrilineatus TaxID=74068 RepID=UPI0023E2F290|nr:peptide methionine sulfoxide reductase-like isoform X1 [Macrosteles quadrilineatus]
MFKSLFTNISNVVRGSSRFTEGSAMELLHDVDVPVEKATFGMGCFWGIDSLYGGKVGVIRTKVGYGGGKMANPTYYNIGDHTEITQVDFDPKKITYEDLLKEFWKNHDPSYKMKTQYCSLILYHSPEQKALAEKTKEEYKQTQKKEASTRIEPFDKFYDAEGYHQKYHLQQHTWLCSALGLDDPDSSLLLQSHVAARLNSFLVGFGSLPQLEAEAPRLGLDEQSLEYVRRFFIKYQGRGITC